VIDPVKLYVDLLKYWLVDDEPLVEPLLTLLPDSEYEPLPLELYVELPIAEPVPLSLVTQPLPVSRNLSATELDATPVNWRKTENSELKQQMILEFTTRRVQFSTGKSVSGRRRGSLGPSF
jgi:hypothetical protein